MDGRTVVVLSVSVAYLAACLVIGMLPGRRTSDSAEGYVAGDRALGPLVMYFITGATIFSAFAFLATPGQAYSRGGAVYVVLAYGAVGFLPFYWLGPRAARVGAAYGFVTQAQMVARRFDSRALAGVMALVSAAAFLPYLALQMKGAGYVLETMTAGAVPEAAGAAIVYGVVLVYVLKSGVLGVGWTNTFQGLFMMALAWGLGLYIPWRLHGGIGPMFERLAAERPGFTDAPGVGGTWGEYTSLVLVTACGFAVWPHLFMKAFSARDGRTLRRTVVLYPTFQLFLVPLVVIGFTGVLLASGPAAADQILPYILLETEGLPALLVGLFCAGALAASMSSGDAMLHATASILVRDGEVTALGRALSPHAERQRIRGVIVLVLLGAYAIAVLYQGSLFRLLTYVCYGPIVQFAPVVYATLLWRRATGAGVLAGLVAGIAVFTAFTTWPEWRPWAWHAGLYGLVANAGVLVVVSLAARRPPSAAEERFLAIAAGREDAAAE